MKIKGIKSTVSVLKKSHFARIYFDIKSGQVFAVQYIDANSFSNFGDDVKYICRYNYRFNVPSIKWVKSMVNDRLFELGYNFNI